MHWMSWDRLCLKKAEGGMGFRKLYDFNLALLGKQAWRLLTHSDILVSRIFKARYYPDGNFLMAKLEANPSYGWRSILASQELLKSGLACRVGNRVSIAVEGNPWLSCANNPYITTTNEALKGKTVSSLMTTDQNSWDIDLVHDIFNERDASLILSIPLQRAENDSWFWRKEKL